MGYPGKWDTNIAIAIVVVLDFGMFFDRLSPELKGFSMVMTVLSLGFLAFQAWVMTSPRQRRRLDCLSESDPTVDTMEYKLKALVFIFLGAIAVSSVVCRFMHGG